DDDGGRRGLLEEADRAVAEQGVGAAGVPGVDLVVAGGVDHARPEPEPAVVAAAAGERGVDEHVGPGAAAAGDRPDAAVHRHAIDLRTVDLPAAVVADRLAAALGHEDGVGRAVGDGGDLEGPAAWQPGVVDRPRHLLAARVGGAQPEVVD